MPCQGWPRVYELLVERVQLDFGERGKGSHRLEMHEEVIHVPMLDTGVQATSTLERSGRVPQAGPGHWTLVRDQADEGTDSTATVVGTRFATVGSALGSALLLAAAGRYCFKTLFFLISAQKFSVCRDENISVRPPENFCWNL